MNEHADRDRTEPPSVVGYIDADIGQPATVFTPPERLRRDPNRWPTPAEFVDEWEQRTATDRLALAQRLIEDGQAAAQMAWIPDALRSANFDFVDCVNRLAGALRRAEAAEAKVARVEVLPDQWEAMADAHDDVYPAAARVVRADARDLRAALAGPEPEATEARSCPTRPHVNCHDEQCAGMPACLSCAEGGALDDEEVARD